eukprot:13056983-Alexandrium_andersonii.AAC.1
MRCGAARGRGAQGWQRTLNALPAMHDAGQPWNLKRVVGGNDKKLQQTVMDFGGGVGQGTMRSAAGTAIALASVTVFDVASGAGAHG